MDVKKLRESIDILSDMRDQKLQFLNGVDTDKNEELFNTLSKEAWACDDGVKALRKQIPHKLVGVEESFPLNMFAVQKCSDCGHPIIGNKIYKYCPECGQKIDWGEGDIND